MFPSFYYSVSPLIIHLCSYSLNMALNECFLSWQTSISLLPNKGALQVYGSNQRTSSDVTVNRWLAVELVLLALRTTLVLCPSWSTWQPSWENSHPNNKLTTLTLQESLHSWEPGCCKCNTHRLPYRWTWAELIHGASWCSWNSY